ncbi:hypothetical protein [Xenorhabdus littoralis]|uniref:hypothetical protein n=1 Tax=Xenorhabdus littoralis TaxID=2582835 RepID=UPI0029E809A6|nr:hypothetical protein [Xenorhabdus sp. psl]
MTNSSGTHLLSQRLASGEWPEPLINSQEHKTVTGMREGSRQSCNVKGHGYIRYKK